MPGLPLDGGRVLKAFVWGVSGNEHRGTLVAGWGGRLTAVAVLAWPLLQRELLDVEPTLFDYVLVFVLAVFLWTGATAAMAQARMRRRLPYLVARPLARRTLTVPEDLPLAEAVRRAHEAGAGSIVTTTSSGRATGHRQRGGRQGDAGRAAAVDVRRHRGPHPRGRPLAARRRSRGRT